MSPAVVVALPAAATADAPARQQEPVVLTGAQLGDWSLPANQTARPPLMDVVDPGADPHNHYADPRSTRRRRSPRNVIPPLDGIYAQWDFNAARVTRFYNAHNPGGVAIDGRNDEAFGNLDDPCNPNDDANDTSATEGYRGVVQATGLCAVSPYHLSVDPGDPSFADANAALGWSEVTGPGGTIVDRISAAPDQATPGGAAQSVAAVPYYRDDSCFDDGTGADPGPKVALRSGDEPRTAADGSARRCWHPEDGLPDGSDRFFQGSIATHGLHLLFLADSDNARQTVPATEIVSDWNLVMLPGEQGNVGEQYGRSFEHPLVATVGAGHS